MPGNHATDADAAYGDASASDRRRAVRDRYGEIAERESSCCGDAGGSDCADRDAAAQSERVGYDADDVDALDEANLGLGCGTPVDHAALQAGETVLDLGSGGGFDCFLAAREVGPDGRVVGVDMTPEMVERARETAAERAGETDDEAPVEFRLGEIEHLPVADASVDVVTSNCVVNLSPDKPRVFAEAFRALRPGGRLAVADVVRTAELPAGVAGDLDALTGCVGGAAPVDRLEALLADAGFVDASVEPRDDDEFMREWADDGDPREFTASALIRARKPAEEPNGTA